MAKFSRGESAVSGNMPLGAIATAALCETEAWAGAHRELLSGIGMIWTDWLKRRRDAIDASIRSLQQMLECRSLADRAQIRQQWLTDIARRGVSDTGALICDALALPWAVTAARIGDPPPPMGGLERPLSTANEPVQRAAAE